MPSNNPTTLDSDPLREILEAGAAAAEKFAADNKAIDRAFATGTLGTWIAEQIPDEYRPNDDAGEGAASAGSGLGGETLGEGSAGA